MNNTNTGGPAFPLVHEIHPEPGHPEGTRAIKVYEGMTLRDYFAAKAMMGLGCNPNHVNMTDDEIAKWSYNLADSMLKAREA